MSCLQSWSLYEIGTSSVYQQFSQLLRSQELSLVNKFGYISNRESTFQYDMLYCCNLNFRVGYLYRYTENREEILLKRSKMNMSHQTSVSLQEKFCLCFCFQDVLVANGTTELLHTEHIWYPRIREVNDEHCLLMASLCFFSFSVLVMPSILQLLTLSSFFFFSY